MRGPGDGLHVAVGGAGHVAGVGPRHEVVGGGGSRALDPALADLLTRCNTGGEVTWQECDTCGTLLLTVLEHPLHVEAVGGARLVVRAALEVTRQLPRARILDYPRVAVVDGV